MTTLSLRKFNGEVPRLPPDRLPEDAAQLAENCDFAHGELRPLKGLPTEYAAAAGAQPVRSVFTPDGVNFFAWNKPTRAYLAPTIDDAYNRVYYRKHGDPLRVAQTSNMKAINLSPGEPTAYWDVGVTAPAAPTFVLGAATGGATETIVVVAVAINIWGEESAPSSPVSIEKEVGQGVTYTVTHTPPAGQQALTGIVFYRTYPGNQNTDYFLVNPTPATLSGGVASFNDVSTEPATTTTLQSTSWDPPPVPIANLTYAGNGVFAASSGRDLVLSEPYRPHAWPYRMSFPHALIAVVAIEGGLLVTTQAQPYIVSGSHPTQMSQQLLPIEQAGWGDTAATRVEGSAIYASNDGLVAVFGGQPSLRDSQALFTRKDWRDAYGGTRLNMRLAHHDGYVLGLIDPSYPTTATEQPFLIRLDEAAGSFARLDVGQALYGASVSGTTDQLFVTTATGFAEFGGGTNLTYTWHSGDKLFPLPVNFAAGVIDCTGSVTIQIYADGALRHSQAVTGRTSFRLPGGLSASRWSVKLLGTAVVREVSLGASFEELRAV